MKLRHRLCVASLLFPALMLGQTAAPPAKPASSPSSGNYPVMSTAAKNRAKQLFGYFESGQSAQLYAAFSEQMRKSGSSAQLTTVSKKIGTEWGREVKVLGENFAPDMLAANTIYSRFSQFAKSKDPILTLMSINQQGEASTFKFQPAPPPSG